MCRYVWLPLWVVPVQNSSDGIPGAVVRERQDIMLVGKEGPGRHPGSSMMPADVVVRWHDLWRFSDFDRVPKLRWESGRFYHM